MKDVGIVGPPQSGKSTLFAALTGNPAGHGRLAQAIVDVPDERLHALAAIEGTKKTVPARVRFVDVPGGLTAQALGEMRAVDVLCLVVPAFGDAAPEKELADLRAELVLADLASVETGFERARDKAKGKKETPAELAALEKARRALEEGRPLRDADLTEDEIAALRGYGALTLKPWIMLTNVSDGDVATPPAFPGGADAIAISATLEAEVAGLNPGEAAELLAGFGIEQRAADRVIAACYEALDLVTFYTTVNDEAHAWEVPRGARAPDAAGAIHSDMQRGFIRAEVVSYDALAELGSWDEARAAGSVRVEGKDYVVQDGDVMRIRFAV